MKKLTLVSVLAIASLMSCTKEVVQQVSTQDQIQGDWIVENIDWRDSDTSAWEFVPNHTEYSFEITESHMGGSPYYYDKREDNFHVIDEEDGQPDRIVSVYGLTDSSVTLNYVSHNDQNARYYLVK